MQGPAIDWKASTQQLPESLLGTALDTLCVRSYAEFPEQVRYTVLIPLVKEARQMLAEMASGGNEDAKQHLEKINQRVFAKLV